MSVMRNLVLAGLLWPAVSTAQNIDALYQQGRAEVAAGNLLAAVTVYTAIISTDPGQAAAHFQLSQLSLDMDDLKNAQDHIRQAIELDDRNQEYRDFAEEIVTITDGLRDAKRSHDNRQYGNAVQKYDELIVAYSNFATLYYRKGLSLQGNGQVDEAVVAFRSAIEHNPRSESYPKAIRTLAVREYQEGDQYYRIRDWLPAEEQFTKALEIDPAFDQAYYRLARTLGRQDRIAEALAVLDRAIAQNPAYLPVRLEKGNLLRGEERNREAAETYLGALAVDPGDYRAMVGLGQALKTDKPTEAAIQLEMALAIKPDIVTANELLGEIYSQQEQWIKARPYLAKAVKLKPKDHFTLWRLAHVENNLGSWEAAKDLARRSVSIDGKFQASWYELGRARKELGEMAGAIQAFKQAERGRDRATAADAARERKRLEVRR